MSASELTRTVTDKNIASVRAQIDRKLAISPYYSTVNNTRAISTDYDVFPYTRWYRGIYNVSAPIIAEREAGWRVLHNNCYKAEPVAVEQIDTKHCFQVACSTVYPCFVADESTDENMIRNKSINGMCNVSFR